MAEAKHAQPGAAEYGREALTQWAEAARYGMRALAARREEAREGPSLRERLDPTQTDKGGKAGDLADAALAKLGSPGRMASKVKLGSRLVERVCQMGQGFGGGRAQPVLQACDGQGAAEGEDRLLASRTGGVRLPQRRDGTRAAGAGVGTVLPDPEGQGSGVV